MKSRKLKILLPLITMGVVALTHVAYADVKVNIKKDKTEGYSYNSDETVNVNVPEPSRAPLASDINEYKDSNNSYNSNVDSDYYVYDVYRTFGTGYDRIGVWNEKEHEGKSERITRTTNYGRIGEQYEKTVCGIGVRNFWNKCCFRNGSIGLRSNSGG